jgi:FixJ family two-component response regulator
MSAAGTVFVVDDDPGVLRALARLLQVSGHEVRTFDSPAAFLRNHDPAAPGCLVLDLSMPELDGLALQSQLLAAGSHRPIVFISGHADIPASVRAMKAGAVDFLTKPFSDEALLAAIDVALERSRAACRVAEEIGVLSGRLASLTVREREVFEHVVAGRLNKLIAEKLGAAEKTIKVHRSRVMHKMQAASLADLVRMAGRIGIGPTN